MVVPVFVVANKQLPTPAALNELTLLQARTPRTGFSMPKHRPPALTFDKCQRRNQRTGFIDTASSCKHDEVFPHRPLFGSSGLSPAASHALDRTAGLLRTDLASIRRKQGCSGLLRRASIELDKPLSWHPARRVSARKVGKPSVLILG